jgi:hypothetical protein
MDGGKEWDWNFYSPNPKANEVIRIEVDPGDPDRLMIVTWSGVWVSHDNGDHFDRVGGFLFTEEPMYGLATSGRPGHFIVASKQDIWETTDAGKTWRIIYYGPTEWTLKWIHVAPSQPDVLWAVTFFEVLRIEPKKLREVDPQALQAYLRTIRREPTLRDTWWQALERAKVNRHWLNQYRFRARMRAFVPQVFAGWTHRQLDAQASRAHLLYGVQPNGPAAFDNQHSVSHNFYSLLAFWNLQDLVFTRLEAPVDRYFYTNNYAFHRIRLSVIEMYLERRRLMLESFIERDRDEPRTRLLRDLRIEELTAHLNALTGGTFLPYSAIGRAVGNYRVQR